MQKDYFQFYNEVAEKYPESERIHSTPKGKYREKVLGELISHLQGRILDIGCNIGRYAKYVHGEYIGLDPALPCLRKFKGNRAWAIAEALPFRENYFDAILLFQTLEHIWNRELVLVECRRVLHVNGKLIISAPWGDDPWDIIWEEQFEEYEIKKFPYLHGGFNLRYLQSLLKDWKILDTKILYFLSKLQDPTPYTIFSVATKD